MRDRLLVLTATAVAFLVWSREQNTHSAPQLLASATGADVFPQVEQPADEANATTVMSPWQHHQRVMDIQRDIINSSPRDKSGKILAANPKRPFTYEEQVYDKPRRDWWWSAGRYAVVLVGGLTITYMTAGIVAPWVGGAIGSLSGLSGAAAVSQGLALLGGGAIAAGGFGMAGGTFVVGIVTDLAISTALEYSLYAVNRDEQFAGLKRAILQLDVNQEHAEAWDALHREARAACSKDYVVTTHAVASAFLRWAAEENIENALAPNTEDAEEEEDSAKELLASDRQRTLLTAALHLLEDARRLQPSSSLIHHSLGNTYWWLSVRGGYGTPVEGNEAFGLPESGRLSGPDADEVACFDAALWHYAAGAAAEPRNVHIRINWANALQSDGTLHEAIAVMSGALPFIADCRQEDRAQVLRTNAMLNYQAFARSPLWEKHQNGGQFPEIEDSPLLMAAMQGYSKAVQGDAADLTSLVSLAQIYRDAQPTVLAAPPSVLAIEEVQFRIVEKVLELEQGLAKMKPTDRANGYRPGQLLEHYKDLMRWCFGDIAARPLQGGRLKRLHASVDQWIQFATKNHLQSRPFGRDVCLRTRNACADYNARAYVGKYSIDGIDRELERAPED
jgi:hypothetical protein